MKHEDGFNGNQSRPEFYLHGNLVGTTYREYQEAAHAVKEKAREQEFKATIPEGKYMGIGVGISEGQATRVALHTHGHVTIGAVHAALQKDGSLIVAVEIEPGRKVEVRPIVRRDPWRFYDFWRFDKEKHDNFIRPEHMWPEIRVYPEETPWP